MLSGEGTGSRHKVIAVFNSCYAATRDMKNVSLVVSLTRQYSIRISSCPCISIFTHFKKVRIYEAKRNIMLTFVDIRDIIYVMQKKIRNNRLFVRLPHLNTVAKINCFDSKLICSLFNYNLFTGVTRMAGVVYGYCRISDRDQNEARQIKAMLDNGVEENYILVDKQSGKDFQRPQYQLLKNIIREGDILIIKSIDRLGRNYKEIIKEWQEMTQYIKADIRVLDMTLLDTTLHKDLLGTFISDLILQVLAYVAEQERQNIRQRQSEGIAIAKLQGKHLGRPRAKYPADFKKIYDRWRQDQITSKRAMQLLSLKSTTFYKLVKLYENNNAESRIPPA